jgi:cytochrome c oxidase subunit 2
VKADVIPGRYNTLWFQATKPGTYHLFCAEYCGTKHSGMIGSVIAMEPVDYQKWLDGGPAQASPVEAGAKLFTDLACITCHTDGSGARGPSLNGVFGHEVELQGGSKVVADEAYLRESIVNPQAKIVNGFQPLMPTFQGMVTEEQLMQLIAYVKSLGGAGGTPAPSGTPAPTTLPDKK